MGVMQIEQKQKEILELFAEKDMTSYEVADVLNCNCPVPVIDGLVKLLVKKRKLEIVPGKYRKGEIDKLYPVYKLKVS